MTFLIDLSFSIPILHTSFSSGIDEQLCGSRELEAFYSIFDIHVDMLGVFVIVAGVELLHVC